MRVPMLVGAPALGQNQPRDRHPPDARAEAKASLDPRAGVPLLFAILAKRESAGGPGAGLPPHPARLPSGSEFESGADVHHRRAPGVDGADDLLGVDPLEVHAGRGHVRVPELTLDHGSGTPSRASSTA